jgi:hypothetical protein
MENAAPKLRRVLREPEVRKALGYKKTQFDEAVKAGVLPNLSNRTKMRGSIFGLKTKSSPIKKPAAQHATRGSHQHRRGRWVEQWLIGLAP